MPRLREVTDDVVLLASLCVATKGPLSEEMRAWMLRLDALFTQRAERLPQVTLSPHQCRILLFTATAAQALQLLPALMKQPNLHGGCDDVPLLPLCCYPATHWVSRLPNLRLFHYGLDPAQTSLDERDGPLSALQLARNFVRDHPATAAAATTTDQPAAMDSTATGAALELDDPESVPSVLAALATQQQESEEAEDLRREALHAQFMHALLPAWRTHSTNVLALLSSPSVLLPDLAVIVGRYLDLEGMQAERSPVVQDEDAESSQ